MLFQSDKPVCLGGRFKKVSCSSEWEEQERRGEKVNCLSHVPNRGDSVLMCSGGLKSKRAAGHGLGLQLAGIDRLCFSP